MAQRPKAPKHTYWRGDTLWARFSVNGVEHRESLRTSEVKDARARVEKIRNRIIGATRFGENRKTWMEAHIEWAEHIAGEVSPSTLKRYAVSINQIEPAVRSKFIDEISKADVLEIVKARRRAKVTNATIRRDLQALSSVLKYAELHDWRVGNPAELIMETISERRDPIDLPTQQDFDHMLTRLSPMMAALMKTALATGARISELTTVDRRGLDYANRTLTVIGKRNKRRTLALDDDTAELLSKLPASLQTKAIFHFDGRPLKNASFIFSKATRAAQKAAREKKREFTGFRFHDLRHWFAVRWLKNGRSIYDLQQHLGHTSVATTEIYLEFLTVDEKERAKRPAETTLAPVAQAV